MKPPYQIKDLAELNFPHVFQSFYFSFKTLKKAKQLANYISSFYPPNNQARIELGLNELFLNAIEHGHLGINEELKSRLKKNQQWEHEIYARLHQLENQSKSVEVFLEISPAYILLKIKDQGEGFNWLQYQEPVEKPSYDLCGRGLILVQTYCFDKVEFSNKGNEISCIMYT